MGFVSSQNGASIISFAPLGFTVSMASWWSEHLTVFCPVGCSSFLSPWLCSSLYFPANNMLLFHSLEISCILPKRVPPGCQTLLSVFGFLRVLWQRCCWSPYTSDLWKALTAVASVGGTGWTKTGTKHNMCIISSSLTMFCFHLCCVEQTGIVCWSVLMMLRTIHTPHFPCWNACGRVLHDDTWAQTFLLSRPHILAGWRATKLDWQFLPHIWEGRAVILNSIMVRSLHFTSHHASDDMQYLVDC